MLIHLIRHGHAGSRRAWTDDDERRPLSEKGHAQSRAISDALADAGVDLLWSSRFLRCIQTLQPLASQLGRPVETNDLLTEGGPGAVALDALLVATIDGHTVAASSHGDVIPAILNQAQLRGARLDGPIAPKKGARYELTVADGCVSHIVYVAPPDRSRPRAQ